MDPQKLIGTELLKKQFSIKEVCLTTKDVVKRQRTSRVFSLEKALSDITKVLVTKAINLTQEDLCDLALEEIADEIESIYPKGIESLMESKRNAGDYKNTYMAFYLNCSNDFRKKFSFVSRINLAVEHFDNTLVHINDPEFVMSSSAKLENNLARSLTMDKRKGQEKPSGFAYLKDDVIKAMDEEAHETEMDSDAREEQWMVARKELSHKMEKSIHYEEILRNIFENFEIHEKYLLDKLINRIKQRSSQNLREEFPEDYWCNNFVMDTLNNVYYNFDFEDVLLTLSRVLTFITEIDIALEFSEDQNLYMSFFAKDEVVDHLAQNYRYEMQMKNYGAYYLGLENKYREELNQQPLQFENSQDENTQLLIKSHVDRDDIDDLGKGIPQIWELEEEAVVNFPPYFPFEVDRKAKFMRYCKNDQCHVCQYDPELNIRDDIILDNVPEGEVTGFFRLEKHEEVESQKLLDKMKGGKDIYQEEKDKIHQEDNKALSSSKHESLCCSGIRNIDRLRLMYRIIDSYLNFKELISANIFKNNTYVRKREDYGEDTSFYSTCIEPLNLFSIPTQLKFITFIRNFYGEKMSFYFLFAHKLMMWMIWPALIGIGYFIFSSIWLESTDNLESSVKLFVDINVHDIVKLIFCGFITVWATLFINTWVQEEVKYSYFWGTDNFEVQEPERENFVPDKKERFIFDQEIAKGDKVKVVFKTLLSYSVIFVVVCVTIYINYLLFNWKADKANEYKKYKEKIGMGRDEETLFNNTYLYWKILIACVNSVVIKIMSYIYKYFVIWATEWENYSTQTKYENALSVKFIIFEFINNYTSLLYIAFFKKLIEGCEIEVGSQAYSSLPPEDQLFIKSGGTQLSKDGNCSGELNIQIYIVLLTNLGINLVELGSPYLMMLYQKMKYIKNTTLVTGGKHVTCEPYSLEYQQLCNEYNTTMSDYIEIIILFGYVSLFSVACPLTPVIVMILLFCEKFVDTCKLLFLSRVTLLERADGIEVFRTIFKVIYFIGMITSILLVIFTQDPYNKYEMNQKVIIFAGVENLILIMMMTLKFNVLPSWFENISLLKLLYYKKYFIKPSEHLPHHYMKGDRSVNFVKLKIEEENAEKGSQKEDIKKDNDDSFVV